MPSVNSINNKKNHINQQNVFEMSFNISPFVK